MHERTEQEKQATVDEVLSDAELAEMSGGVLGGGSVPGAGAPPLGKLLSFPPIPGSTPAPAAPVVTQPTVRADWD